LIRRRIVLSFLAALFAVGVAGESGAVPNQSRIWIAGTTLKVRDASTGSYYNDFDNGVIVKVKRDEGAAYASDVAGTLIPGPGCVAFSGEDTSAGRPEDLYHPDEGDWTVRCPFTILKKVDINVGAGNDLVWLVLSHVPAKIVGGANADEIEVFSCTPPPYFAKTNINGGLGDDYIVGGQGDDTLVGQRGYDYIEGTCGEDRISAGSDDDEIFADDTNWCDTDCPPTTDRINCGDGEDGVTDDGVDIVFANCEN
jgi:hypothetical protein